MNFVKKRGLEGNKGRLETAALKPDTPSLESVLSGYLECMWKGDKTEELNSNSVFLRELIQFHEKGIHVLEAPL